MTYHANHSTCHNSCWENRIFHSEVMVCFGENLTRNDILENNHEKDIYLNTDADSCSHHAGAECAYP